MRLLPPQPVLFERFLLPDLFTEHYYNVTPDLLAQLGISGLICDIDNTLAPYEQPDPTPELMQWFAAMTDAGIRIAFVSNNDASRVERFNRNLGYPAYPKSRKPLTGSVRRAMADMGTDVTTTAVLGDQLFTDAAAGKLCGLTAIIVPPIRDKKTLLFRIKRRLERPYMNLYRRRHMYG